MVQANKREQAVYSPPAWSDVTFVEGERKVPAITI